MMMPTALSSFHVPLSLWYIIGGEVRGFTISLIANEVLIMWH